MHHSYSHPGALRSFIKRASLGLCAVALVGLPAMAAGYPEKSIRIIGPFSAGSGTDTAARVLADGLSRTLGQPVVVENKPGANTLIGTMTAVKAPADGYTMLMITADNMLANPAVKKDIGYKLSDVDPVAIVGEIPLVILAPPNFPYNSVAELQRAAKQDKRVFSFGTWGNGSVAHIIGAMLAKEGGFELNFVPFQGSAPSTNAVMGGHVDLAVAIPSTAVNLVLAGKAKALAIGGKTRIADLPNTPTFVEAGLPKVLAVQWHGIAVRSNGNQAIIGRLQQAIDGIYADAGTREKLLKMGYLRVGGLTPDQFKSFIQAQVTPWTEAVKAGGITDNP